VEIREFANEVMQGQSATIDMDVWNIDESKLEDFISEQATIFVSTIHQTKGREFDNVYLVISENKGLNDADYRQLYVAITRAKNNLHIFCTGDYFDDVRAEGLIRLEDRTCYINHIVWWRPKDVNLDSKVDRMIVLPNIEFVKS